jgi:hypothetical protein
MSESNIRADVVQLIARHIRSIEQLEILLLLYRQGQPWSAEEVSRELRSSAMSAAHYLEIQTTEGLLARSGPDRFIFQPADPRITEVVEQLAEFYKERPLRVIDAIYGSRGSVSEFADAFRLRRDPGGDK